MLAGAAALAGTPAAGAPLDRQGDWQILSVAEGGTHRLDYCAAQAQFAGGVVLTVERDPAGRTVVAIETSDKPFASGPQPARIAAGTRMAREITGHGAGADTFVLPLGRDEGLAAALAAEATLRLDTPRGPFVFALGGAGRAMDDLARCAAGRVRPSDRLIDRALDAVGADPVQTARPAGSREDDDLDYAWHAGEAGGGGRQTRIAPGAAFLDLVLPRLDRLAARCAGAFAPRLDAPVEVAGTVILTGSATCRATGAPRVVAMLYARLGICFLEFVLDTPEPAERAAIRARDRLADALRKLSDAASQ